jgi:hypothetical protein
VKRSFQTLSEISATCVVCEARCDARNAQVWAHTHARMTGHVVYVAPIFKVTSAQGFMFAVAEPKRAKKRGGG